MTQDGIDLKRSGWENPDGFVPRPRDAGPAVRMDDTICGDQHPDGWVCELTPGHQPPEVHVADNGAPGGVRWTRSLHDVTAIQDGPPGTTLIQGHVTETIGTPMDRIRSIAARALESQLPSNWAIALSEIAKVAGGE